jgi:hypothetical protein
MRKFPSVLQSRFAQSDWASHFYTIKDNGDMPKRGERALEPSDLKLAAHAHDDEPVFERFGSFADSQELGLAVKVEPDTQSSADADATNIESSAPTSASVFADLARQATIAATTELFPTPRGYHLGAGRAFNSAGIAKTWTDRDIAAARLNRTSVEVTTVATGEVRQFRSVRDAFRELNLPDSKHIRFRGLLKASVTGTAEYVHVGRTYCFKIVPLMG